MESAYLNTTRLQGRGEREHVADTTARRTGRPANLPFAPFVVEQVTGDQREWEQYHTPKDLAIGLTTESGELLEQFRFKNEEDQAELLVDPESREAIEDELADVLFFLLRFADLYDIDLEAALVTKLEKNRARYPEKEYTGSNDKYDQ